MSITLMEDVTNYFETKGVCFIVYTRKKFFINNPNIKSPKGILFITAITSFWYQGMADTAYMSL